MKTWDPLSLFKYLTGSPNIHVTFAILLAMNIKNMVDEPALLRPLCAGDPDAARGGLGESAYEKAVRLFALK